MKPVLARFRPYPAPIRIIAFALILLLLWLPFLLPLQWLIPDRNLAGIITLVILYVEFLCLVRVWGRQVHRQQRIFWSYGLDVTRRSGRDILIGLSVGLLSILTLFGIESLLGWVQWQSLYPGLVRIVLEGLLSALAFGFAEELLFRGWLLDELERDYVPALALWANAIVFAALHLRLWTFPSLVMLGVALVWAKRSRSESMLGKRRDRLALPIGLHAGLVWGNYILEVGKLIQYGDRVPAWVTGIDRNPLAGIMGFAFLSLLAIGVWRFATRQTVKSNLF